MDRYSPFLRADYPTEVLRFYVQYLIKAAQQATNRNMYRNLMPYLKRWREYPGGAESAKALAESWKTEYKRRPAMMDELKKAGFWYREHIMTAPVFALRTLSLFWYYEIRNFFEGILLKSINFFKWLFTGTNNFLQASAKTFSDMHGRRLVIRQYVPFPMLHVVQVP